MIYDGVDISKYVVVEEIKRPLVNISINYGEVPGIDGLVFRKKKNNSKTIEIRIRLIEDLFNKNLNETRDKLNELLVKEKPRKLELSDYPDRYEMAILEGEIDFEKFIKTGLIVLTFINLSGFFYSKNISDTTTNIGNKPCPVLIKGQISSNLVTIIHERSLKKITLDTTGFIGQSLSVDTELEEIKINNNLKMKSLYFDSDFFYLDPGKNTLKISGLSSFYYSSRARWL